MRELPKPHRDFPGRSGVIGFRTNPPESKCHIDGCYYCSRECDARGDECNATELEECVGCKQDNDCKTQAALRECVECAACADNNCQNPNEGI